MGMHKQSGLPRAAVLEVGKGQHATYVQNELASQSCKPRRKRLHSCSQFRSIPSPTLPSCKTRCLIEPRILTLHSHSPHKAASHPAQTLHADMPHQGAMLHHSTLTTMGGGASRMGAAGSSSRKSRSASALENKTKS